MQNNFNFSTAQQKKSNTNRTAVEFCEKCLCSQQQQPLLANHCCSKLRMWQHYILVVWNVAPCAKLMIWAGHTTLLWQDHVQHDTTDKQQGSRKNMSLRDVSFWNIAIGRCQMIKWSSFVWSWRDKTFQNVRMTIIYV